MNEIHLLIIGAGKGGVSLLKLFEGIEGVKILGVVDKRPDAPGVQLAREMGIPVATKWNKFCDDPRLNIILNVTGNPGLRRELEKHKRPDVEIIDGQSAHFMWRLIEECQTKEELRKKYLSTKRELDKYLREDQFIIGKSPAMQEVKKLIARVAPMPTTVLLRGETGTGKEMVARAIHSASHLRDKPFITVNCTALTASLMESELFGYRKGAFTGAEEDRRGLLEEADGGTVFLDEIGDMNLELQAKLLRFLQTGEIRPVGSTRVKFVTVRIIAATNRNLEKAIEAGEFRKDLFYRFNTFTITLPPLRERSVDIPYLAYHFLTRAEYKLNKRVEKISDDALNLLSQYHWPGNVRELENVIERAVILAPGGTILPEHLPLQIKESEKSGDFQAVKSQVIGKFEKETIRRYIEEANGNISQASRLSGIPRRTFYRLMKKYGL